MSAIFRRIEPYLTPLLAFGGVFLGSLIPLSIAASYVASGRRDLVLNHLASLAAAAIASGVCVFGLERGRWELGVFVSPRRAVGGVARGFLVASLVVGVTDVVILVVSNYRHVLGDGLNGSLLLALLLPAAFGEELLFRGYVLQKLYRTSPGYAVLVTSLLFAFAHGGNPAIGFLSFVNILLAGILLALMWAWDRSLWGPTWAHFFWNMISGPVLGHELSGLDLGPTFFSEVDPGPAWLTGGEFGIEASAVLTLVLTLAIWLLVRRIRSQEDALRRRAPGTEATVVPEPDRLSGPSANQTDEMGVL